jgi:hypothetical protein
MKMDQFEEHGIRIASAHLALIQAAYDERTAMMVAAALAVGARNWIRDRHGSQAAYEFLSGLADDCLGNESVKI